MLRTVILGGIIVWLNQRFKLIIALTLLAGCSSEQSDEEIAATRSNCNQEFTKIEKELQGDSSITESNVAEIMFSKLSKECREVIEGAAEATKDLGGNIYGN